MTLRSGLARLERQIGGLEHGGNGNGRHEREERLQAVRAAIAALVGWANEQSDPDAHALADQLVAAAEIADWHDPVLQASVRGECAAPPELLRALYHAIGGGSWDAAGPEEVMVRLPFTPMGRFWHAGHIYGEHPWPEGEHPGWRAAWNEAHGAHPLLGARELA